MSRYTFETRMRDHPYTINGLSWDLESNTSRQPETSNLLKFLGQVSIISGLSIGRLLTLLMLLCLCFFLFGWLVGWLVVATVSTPDPSPLMSTMPGQISTKGDRPACQTSSSGTLSFRLDYSLGW